MIFNRPAQGGPEVFTDVFLGEFITDQSIFSAMKRSPYIAPLYVGDQVGIVYERGGRQEKNSQFISKHIVPNGLSFSNTASINYIAPLFTLDDEHGRHANFDIQKLQELFSDVEQPDENSRKVYPEDILDYIYASLHSPSYRKKYQEFLKTDFPKIPRPAEWLEFWRLVELGRELRNLHLMKGPINYTTTFPEQGDNIVEKVKYEDSKVWINSTQYFGNVPALAWNFYIGGYQPAQKWLKDRKGQPLSNDDTDHYQRIIKILIETDKIMKEIG